MNKATKKSISPKLDQTIDLSQIKKIRKKYRRSQINPRRHHHNLNLRINYNGLKLKRG